MWAQGSQWNQMPLDAAAYQNISHELVDWAALAQQWIQMKEAHDTAVVNMSGMIQNHVAFNPMQPVNIHHLAGLQARDSHVNGGEAPMDVEREDEHTPVISSDISWPPHILRPQLPASWIPPQPLRIGMAQQIGGPISALPPAVFPQIAAPISALPPVFITPQMTQPAPGLSPKIPNNSQPTTPSVNSAPSLPRLPLLLQSSRQGSSDEDSNGVPSSASAPIDAAKRKNLPAWIREGLEKMEREKQKREERERFLREREFNRKKQLIEETLETNPAASRFDDSDESNHDANDSESDDDETTRSPPNSSQTLSSEDLVLVIRKLMTEVLLEVTAEEIRSAAVEVYQHAKVKSRQVQHSLPSKSLTQKLGLDQYGSDSDEDDADGAADQPTGNRNETTMSGGNPEGVVKTEQSSTIERTVDGTPCLISETKVETDSLKQNGSVEADQSDSQEKEMRPRCSNVKGNFSGSDKRSPDTSKEKKRDRRRSRSRDRRSRRDRSRSRRRSRSRGRRSSRGDRRDSSRDRKRSRRSSSREKRRSLRADSRERSRSSSRSKNRDYRRSRS